MYNHFFGFRERPFKLVPDPDYLFLGKSHEEALAHLRYAVTDGEGFVEIIGEIGTGKTMLCRTFLESLDPDTESAYIFNPRMDARDLLKAINDEFGILKTHDSIKALIDELNAFLIEKKAAGHKVILLIDEAQNLSKDVLEQIRLLSNLETTKDKLLQILLVGQPELADKLDSYELRQLGQRISLRCRLHPFTYAETKAYIGHRVRIASKTSSTVFSNSAIRQIFRFSRGIPRMVNMACDRSLLTAFGRHQLKVTGSSAKSAIRELVSRGDLEKKGWIYQPKRVFAASVAAAAVIAAVLLFYADARQLISTSRSSRPAPVVLKKESGSLKPTFPPQPTVPLQPDELPSLPEAENSVGLPENTLFSSGPVNREQVPAVALENASPVDFQTLLKDIDRVFTKNTAFKDVLSAWEMDGLQLQDIKEIDDEPAFFFLAAKQAGLVATPVENNLALIVRLNIPAILKFNHPAGKTPVYLTAIKATPEALVFAGSETRPEISVPYDRVMEYWSGSGVVFWKNFYNYQGVIPGSAPGESIITLKLHLRDIGYQHIGISGTYDLATRMAVQAIQARHGIPIDGVVGPLTKIVLYNEKQSLAIPHLWRQMKLPEAAGIMKISPREPNRVSMEFEQPAI